jgi:hypothetical protein
MSGALAAPVPRWSLSCCVADQCVRSVSRRGTPGAVGDYPYPGLLAMPSRCIMPVKSVSSHCSTILPSTIR